MHIKSVEFAGAIGNPTQKPPGKLPQVAFSGRSNVGKSSLINRLLGRTRTQIARVSSTPGKTQQINFFQVRIAGNDEHDVEFYLVDLPGYGYAKVPQGERDSWRPLIEAYLSSTRELRGVIQLIDARHGPTPEDLKMVSFLAQLELPALFALTKVDKLTRSQMTRHIDDAVSRLGVSREQVVPFSALNGAGRDELLESLADLLEDEK